jgi:transcriptional regulator with XRE-family HTH domain
MHEADLDFRERLTVELMRRCAENPRYSLRAFARFLQVDHATLSQILRGKRAVSASAIRKWGMRLGLDAAAIERLAQTPPAAHAEDATVMGWQERAILEHVRVKDFVPSVSWLAKVLDTTIDEVQVALHRLLRLGLLRMDGERWVDASRRRKKSEEE